MKKLLVVLLVLLSFVFVLASCDESGNNTGDQGTTASTTAATTAHVHAEEVIPAVPATCTETGLTEGKKCTTCGEILVPQATVAALGHTEVVDTAKAPTCTETGLTEGKHCSICNEVLVAQNTVDALGHTEVADTAVAPTCTETGLTEGKHCSVCNGVLVAQEKVPANGHVWDNGAVTTEPTCTDKGVKTYTCGTCSETKTEETPANGHSHSTEWTVDLVPTCTAEGSQSHHCTVCGDKTDITVIPANGHSYSDEWTIDVEPTCTEVGSKSNHCTVCDGKGNITEITPKGHSYHIEVTYPTCISRGSTTKTCTFCNEVVVESWNDITFVPRYRYYYQDNGTEYYLFYVESVTGGAILYENGVLKPNEYTVKITNTNFDLIDINTVQESVGSLMATYSYTKLASDYRVEISDGYSTYTYETSFLYKDPKKQETLVTPHNYDIVISEPTKTESGSTTYTCKVCNNTYTEFLPATGSLGLAYTINSDGTTCTITGVGTCTDTEILIPTVIDGYTVTAIGDQAFDRCSTATKIVLSDTVTTIGFRAFQYCTSLTELTLPSTVRSLGEQIFMECSSLTTVYYNTSASIAEGKTVLKTPYIKKVVFGDNLSTIPSYVCYACDNIEEVEIPVGVTSIGSYSFYQCTSLKEINLPEGLTYTGFYGFHSSGLRKIILPSTVTSVDNSFRNCDYLEYVVIPVGLTAIEGQAFYVCGMFKTFYMGTETEWQYVSIESYSTDVAREVYFYSEVIHPGVTNEWHFDENGEPIINNG